jgi:hypothetical protein
MLVMKLVMQFARSRSRVRASWIYPFLRILWIKPEGGVFFAHRYLTGRGSLQEL